MTTPHYHIDVKVNANDAQIIKKELREFIRNAGGGLNLRIRGDNEDDCSLELSLAIKNVIVAVFAACEKIKFIQ